MHTRQTIIHYRSDAWTTTIFQATDRPEVASVSRSGACSGSERPRGTAINLILSDSDDGLCRDAE